MMKLIVRRKGQVLTEMILEPSKSWIAGRKPDSDILLEGDKGISREHFKIFEEQGIWKLEVLSKLGNVTAEGAPVVSTIVLSPGSIFSLTPYEFEMSVLEVATEAEPALVTNTNVEVSLSDRTVVHQVSLSAYIKLMNEEGDIQQKIRLEGGDTWVAGRDANTHILISDHKVSRRQFEIRKTSLGFEIVDLGSVNGTYINEKVLEPEDAVLLKSGDVIRVLNHTLIFEVLDPNFFEKVEKLPSIIDPEVEEVEQQEYLPVEVQTEGPAADSYVQIPLPEEASMVDPKAARTKKIRFALVGLILIGAIVYFGTDQSGNKDEISNVAPVGADPLSALTAQQKSEYRQSLELAKRYHMEGNYNLALSETEELLKKFNVKDPELDRVKNTAQAAIESQKLLVRQEKEEKEREHMESRIQTVAAKCGKNLNQYNREEDLDNCLVEALQLNPAHASILDLKTRMQALMMEKDARRQQKADYNRRVAQLRSLHDQAKAVEAEDDYLKTIAAYKKVIASSLPDPEGLKQASENHLAKLKVQMDKKIKEYQKQSTDFKSKKQLKQAIMVLRSAVKIDPTRDDLKDRADELKNELRKQMMVYYQEGVLEESFGNVDGGDNRVGAKEKWKKIIELDVTDGEYYQKAFIKLKKYGAN